MKSFGCKGVRGVSKACAKDPLIYVRGVICFEHTRPHRAVRTWKSSSNLKRVSCLLSGFRVDLLFDVLFDLFDLFQTGPENDLNTRMRKNDESGTA